MGWHSNYLYEEYKDERGLQTAYIYLYASTSEEAAKLRNLQCVWDDMVYTLWDGNPAVSRYGNLTGIISLRKVTANSRQIQTAHNFAVRQIIDNQSEIKQVWMKIRKMTTRGRTMYFPITKGFPSANRKQFLIRKKSPNCFMVP